MLEAEQKQFHLIKPRDLIYRLQQRESEKSLSAISSGNENFNARNGAEFADQMSHYMQLPEKERNPLGLPTVASSRLQEAAEDFHTRAGTLNDDVKRAIDLLATDAPRIRIAHQPNLYFHKSEKLRSLFTSLSDTTQDLQRRHGMSVVPIYLGIDYDDAEDKRFRRADLQDEDEPHLPYSFKGAVSPKDYGKVMYVVPKPDRETLKGWQNQQSESHRRQYKAWSEEKQIIYSRRNIYKEAFRDEKRMQDEAWERAETLVDFNMFLLSAEMNREQHIPVVFIPGHALLPALQPTYEALLARMPEVKPAAATAVETLREAGVELKYNPASEPFPFWYTCDTCDHRVSLEEKAATTLSVQGDCQEKECRQQYDFHLGEREKPDLSLLSDRISPRVLFDDVANEYGLQFDGGVDYVGSAEHMLVSNMTVRNLGANHLPPHLLIPPQK